jgi:gamma-glutamylcyclotransferase
MSRRTRPLARPADRAQTVYFAFGSNLHLDQMAKRCPESRYLGRGTLRGFKWQINTRGYANILESPPSTVEGLCFLLSKKDEETLDRREGVNMVPSAYEKELVDVLVYPSNPMVVGRRVREVDNIIHQTSFTSFKGFKYGGEKVKALVYLSRRYTSDGSPQPEYNGRIHAGIQDAMLLGVPASYFNQNVVGQMHRAFPKIESVSQEPSFQDQRHETSSGERLARIHENRRESRPYSSSGSLGLWCSHGRRTTCRDCVALGDKVRLHSRSETSIANVAHCSRLDVHDHTRRRPS